MAELSGRTALITGADQNVGAETARVLAGHGSGSSSTLGSTKPLTRGSAS